MLLWNCVTFILHDWSFGARRPPRRMFVVLVFNFGFALWSVDFVVARGVHRMVVEEFFKCLLC